MCLAVLTDGNGNSILCIYLLCVVMSIHLVTNCTAINRRVKIVLVFISVGHNNIEVVVKLTRLLFGAILSSLCLD